MTTAQETTEDCLHLNVWAPLSSNGAVYPNGTLAVMVFIHGGGFIFGSATTNLYDGTKLSLNTQTVVVTLNYRLGVLGFFRSDVDGPMGNMGLMDQVMALKWVQSNVARFGGDKNRVTVFGESAGSASINYLMMSPVSENLFQKVILQSGVATNDWAFVEPKEAEKAALALANSVGCEAEEMYPHTIDCLRSKEASALVKAQNVLQKQQSLSFGPTTDTVFFNFNSLDEAVEREVAKSKSEAKEVMIGFNRDEGTLGIAFSGMPQFGPGVKKEDPMTCSFFDGLVRSAVPEAETNFVMDRIRSHYHTGTNEGFIGIRTDLSFRCEIAEMAMKLGKNRPVHTYVWDVALAWVEKVYPYVDAAHALELIPLWGRPFANTTMYTNEERELAKKMQRIWGRFANESSLGESPFDQPVSPGQAFVIEKGDGPKPLENIDMEKCEFLECLPSLAQFASKGFMDDPKCMEFAAAPRS